MPGIDDFVKLLVHGNQTDQFDDVSIVPKTMTPTGDIFIETDDTFYDVGNGAMAFDGAGDLLDTPFHSDFNLGTDDWTIDFWMYANATNGVICQQVLVGASVTWDIWYQTTSILHFENNAGISLTWSGITLNTATLYHIAIQRSGSTFELFIDGVSQGTKTDSASFNAAFSGLFQFGRFGTGSTYDFNGYINEFRFSKGIARYSGNFTPPTEPYSLDVNDSEVLLEYDIEGSLQESEALLEFDIASPQRISEQLHDYDIEGSLNESEVLFEFDIANPQRITESLYEYAIEGSPNQSEVLHEYSIDATIVTQSRVGTPPGIRRGYKSMIFKPAKTLRLKRGYNE